MTAATEASKAVYFPVRSKFPWGQFLQAAVVIVIVGWVIVSFVVSGVFDFATVARYLFGPQIWAGLWGTVSLATLSTAIALVLGTLVALMRISSNRVLSGVAAAYVFFFRGTPMLVQLLIWFYAIPRMIGQVRIGIPFTDVVWVDQPASVFFTPFIAGLFALSLAETGYMAEVVRSGILGVDQGQRDAAAALGLPRRKITTQIVLVQAFRIILPSAGNQYIMMIKNTSLAYTIGYMELLLTVSRIYYSNFKYLELLLVAAFWYLVLTALITFLQQFLERRFPAR
ncbi:amino acid ABC transporter permease [Micropruina sp.]|uniref:amino acid ABC transporter permease n=1 Tax=Micropruina sp. TaxID=2737536 RepID=UPI00262692D3|nr:amino acid ABC transporter permease [Micropruina sp.]